MAKEKEVSEDIYYVGVSDPVELRRTLLESSKIIISFLKRYEDIKNLRTKKAEAVIQLNNQVEDIRKLVARVRRDLPKTKLRQDSVEEKKVAKPKTLKAKIGRAEIEKLEEELSDIENKLKSLK